LSFFVVKNTLLEENEDPFEKISYNVEEEE
jgi:hypothetical protein